MRKFKVGDIARVNWGPFKGRLVIIINNIGPYEEYDCLLVDRPKDLIDIRYEYTPSRLDKIDNQKLAKKLYSD